MSLKSYYCGSNPGIPVRHQLPTCRRRAVGVVCQSRYTVIFILPILVTEVGTINFVGVGYR